MAYCLIGLLNIPLSIAYGEGERAFYRLQVEILQQTADMGLFVWQGQAATNNSMLAIGPHCFSSLALQPLFPPKQEDDVDHSYSLTNRGLRIPLSVYSVLSGLKDAVNMPANSEITLKVEQLGSIKVKLETRESYEVGQLAVLGEVASQSSGRKYGLAILLCFKHSQWKRIATKEHIKISRPSGGWKTPKIRFIQ
jgi:hypothetical protein